VGRRREREEGEGRGLSYYSSYSLSPPNGRKGDKTGKRKGKGGEGKGRSVLDLLFFFRSVRIRRGALERVTKERGKKKNLAVSGKRKKTGKDRAPIEPRRIGGRGKKKEREGGRK